MIANPETIPAELRTLPTWIRWKSVPDTPKPRKIPVRPSAPDCAKSNDPSTWGTFGDAFSNVGKDGTCGVGFVFSGDYFGIDLDGCLTEEGRPDAKAADLISRFSTYTEISPSGTGLHLIGRGTLKGHRGMNRSGVELYDKGRYFTMTGNAFPGATGAIAECQSALDELVAEMDPPRPARPVDRGRIVERARAYVEKMPPAISGQGGHEATFRVALALVKGFSLDTGMALQLLRDYNGRCDPPWSEKELEHKIDDAGKADVPDGYIVERDSPAPSLRPASVSTPTDWQKRLIWRMVKKGPSKIEPHLANVIEILTHDERWRGVLSLNEFSQIDELVRPAPHEPQGAGVYLPRPVIDSDVSFICAWLAHAHNLLTRTETVGQAIAAVSSRNRYHPVLEYLHSLEWDGIERIGHWLEDYCGAYAVTGSANYIRDVGRAFLIGAVARPSRPGCKLDHVLILEGSTGIKKSEVFKILGAPWFTDHLGGEIGSKDAAQSVQGVWIIELAELDHMSRTDVARMKAFTTTTSDRFRAPYGKIPMRYDRQSVFAGTVNHFDYLRDETGNRRFWPVRCAASKIKVEELQRDRDQLWAEAVHAYQAGEKWWLEDESAARGEQEERMASDAWEGPLLRLLSARAGAAGGPLRDRPFVTMEDAMGTLGLPIERQGLSEQRRVSSILKRLKWDRKKVRISPLPEDFEWRYVRSDVPDVPDVPDYRKR